MPAIRVKAVDAPPFLRVKGLGGGAPVFEAWTTPTGTENAQISRYKYFQCINPETGNYIVMAPWDYTYAITEICTRIDGNDVWMPADRTLIDVMRNSEVKLSIYSSYETQISKIRYTMTPRDYYHMVGYSKRSAMVTQQYLSDSPLKPVNDFYHYQGNASLVKEADRGYLSRFRIHKATNMTTGEVVPVESAFYTNELYFIGIWVYKIAIYRTFPEGAVFQFEYGIED